MRGRIACLIRGVTMTGKGSAATGCDEYDFCACGWRVVAVVVAFAVVFAVVVVVVVLSPSLFCHAGLSAYTLVCFDMSRLYGEMMADLGADMQRSR